MVRGLVRRAQFGSCSGLAFVGRSTIILAPRSLHLGTNCYVGPWSYVDCRSVEGVHLGDNVTIREFGWVQCTSAANAWGIGVWIGDSTYIGPRVILGAAGPLRIGSRCQIGAGVSFVAENHGFERGEHIIDQGASRRGIVVGDDCWFGNGVTVLDGVTIGAGVVVGAGAVVTRDLPAHVIAVGVPARILRER